MCELESMFLKLASTHSMREGMIISRMKSDLMMD